MTAEQETKSQGFLIMEPPPPRVTAQAAPIKPACSQEVLALEAPPRLSPGPWLEGRSEQGSPRPPPTTPTSAPSHLML